MCATHNTSVMVLFVILITVILLIAVTTATTQQQRFDIIISLHALERHGSDAERVIDCIERNGPMEHWIQPNGRHIWLCYIGPEYGILITEDENMEKTVTAFIKNKMKSLSQVHRYLINRGGIRVK